MIKGVEGESGKLVGEGGKGMSRNVYNRNRCFKGYTYILCKVVDLLASIILDYK